MKDTLIIASLYLLTFSISSSVVEITKKKKENSPNVQDIFDKLKSIKKNLERFEGSLNAIDNQIDAKVKNLTMQVEVIKRSMNESWKHFVKKTSPTSLPFLPKSANNSSQIPICTARFCLQRMSVRTDIADSIQTLSVSNDSSISNCVSQCFANVKCEGVRLSPGKCIILSLHHPHIEVNYSLNYTKYIGKTQILVKKGSQLGYCRFRFPIRWKYSQYTFLWADLTWKKAFVECQRQRGKLAELTTWDEISYLSRHRSLRRLDSSFHVAAVQANGSTEPDKGWYWTPSNISIPSHGFAWKLRKPDNKGDRENFLGAEYYRGRIRFMDNFEGKEIRALCECLSFGTRESWFYLGFE